MGHEWLSLPYMWTGEGRKLRMSPVQRNGKLKTGIKMFSETMKQFLSFVVLKLNLTYRIFAC